MTFRLLLCPHMTLLEEQLEDTTISTARLKALFLFPSLRLRGLDWKPAEPTATTRPTTLSLSLPPPRPARTTQVPTVLPTPLEEKTLDPVS